MNVPGAKYEILYNSKNITNDILAHAKSFTYTDNSEGKADELELELEDSDSLWTNEWFPDKGDTISAKVTANGQTLDCGTFTIDELSAKFSKDGGNAISIKAIAAGVKKPLRSKNHYAHENKTLREIANTIAAKYSFTVSGTISDISIGRITQYNETDLNFLNRLASEYGYSFSVRDTQLVFTDIFDLETNNSALVLKRADIISIDFSDKCNETYKSVQVRHKSTKNKAAITYDGDDEDSDIEPFKEDILVTKTRAENKQQAERKGKFALHQANTQGKSGSLTMPGNVLILAGNNCDVTEYGNFSGKYFIVTSKHTVTPDGGYVTSADLRCVASIDTKYYK
jgi:phage protein D